MFFLVFWRGSGENPQITSAQDRGVSWRRLIRPHRKLQHFGPARWRLGGLGWAGWPRLTGFARVGRAGLRWAAVRCTALHSHAHDVHLQHFRPARGRLGGLPRAVDGRAPYKGGHRIGRPYRVAPLIGCAHPIRSATLEAALIGWPPLYGAPTSAVGLIL